MAAGTKNNNKVYFSGAPRFRHKGQVVVFYKGNTNWIVKYREVGQQVSIIINILFFFKTSPSFDCDLKCKYVSYKIIK